MGVLGLMSETVNVELTKTEREFLLRGLSFVRSSILLETRDPIPDDEARRKNELNAIATLADRLQGVSTTRKAASV
jgi:hypothetical protein